MPPNSDEPLEVELSGDLTVQTIGRAHAQLAEAFADVGDVRLSLGAVTTADLTLVQLIEAARRSAREAEGSLVLAAPAEGGLLEILERGGFVSAPDQREFWLQAGGEA